MAAVLARAAVLESLRHTVRGPLVLRLFSNDAEPHRRQIATEFVEADFPGYAPIALPDAAWAEAGTDPVTLACPKQTFTLTADLPVPAKVYGHYLTRGEAVVWAERGVDANGRPRKLEVAHSRVEVTPTLVEKK